MLFGVGAARATAPGAFIIQFLGGIHEVYFPYALAKPALILGLIAGAHPSTPLGRGRGVVVGMLGCFLIGLVWICVFYVFSNDISGIWVFNDLSQWNLVVGIGFMAVGFAYATKWE